jgi:NitT/TauT family transport system substrate-binding protein
MEFYIMKKLIATLLIVSFIFTALLFTACSDKEKGSDVLKIGYSGSLCEAPLHIAYEKGYFEGEGLEVELVKLAPGTAFDALTAGQIDACFALLASMIQPLANGLPAKITTGLHTGCDIVLVKPDSGITKAEDLKGKKVGVPSMTSSPIIFAKRVLADNGVDIRAESSEVEFIVYNTSDLPLILSNGDVDAIAMNEPTATIAANEYGYVALFDSAVDKPYSEQYCCVAYVSDRILESNKELAIKYTKAMMKASAYIQGHQDEITQIQVDKNYVAGDAAVNAEVLKKFNYIPSVQGAYDAFGITAPQLQAIGMLSEDIDTDVLQKNSFVFLEGLEVLKNESGECH